MTDYSETGESPVSDEARESAELYEAVEETISDWVADESVDMEREGGNKLADEGELIKNILTMIAISLDEINS
jgi:hypothetical protein